MSFYLCHMNLIKFSEYFETNYKPAHGPKTKLPQLTYLKILLSKVRYVLTPREN